MAREELSEKLKMLVGLLYDPKDPVLVRERNAAASILHKINHGEDGMARERWLQDLLGSYGEGCEVRSSFFCDYGYNIHFGRGVFLNFNCVLLDVMPIEIGDGTQIGPGVQIYAADHPRESQARLAGLECGKPVKIGSNVWIGGGAILLPGISVGDNAIIGAGSVVTRDVPAGTMVVGNPARLISG